MSEPQADPAARFAAWVRAAANIAAPTTVLSALLVYFGYVATLARFEHFGVYLDMADLSSRRLVLYGVEVVYVPLALVGIATLVGLALHAAAGWLLDDQERTEAWGGWAVASTFGLAVLLLLRALVGILRPRVAMTEFPGTTALSLVLGAGLVAYGFQMLRTVLAARGPRPVEGAAPRWFDRPVLVRGGAAAVAVVVLAGLFWAANSFAGAYGAGRALDDEAALAGRPEVLLDTRYRLNDLPPGTAVTETVLPVVEGDPYRWRYRGLRVLVATPDRLFLVPAPWTEGSRTVVVPYGDAVSLQLDP